MWLRLFLTAVLAAGAASAQRGGGGGGGGDEGGMGGGMGSMESNVQVRRQTRQEMLIDKLKLNKEQKEEAAKILSAAMEKAAPTRELLSRGRAVIANTITGKGSEEDLKKLLAEYATVSARLTGIEAETFAKLFAMVKPNQRAKASQAFELMDGMFDGGGIQGGGRGRGGQGRGEGRQ